MPFILAEQDDPLVFIRLIALVIVAIRVYYRIKFHKRDVKTTETRLSLIRVFGTAIAFCEVTAVAAKFKVPGKEYAFVQGFIRFVEGFTTLPTGGIQWLGVWILGIGTIILLIVHMTMQRSWFWLVAEQKHQKLVTHGPFQYVRHPMYTCVWFIAAGFGLGTANTLVLMFGIGLALTASMRIPQEEDTCVHMFGDEYIAYRRRVSYRIIPCMY